MKKLLVVVLVLTMAFSVGCAPKAPTVAEQGNWKIGIVTGTVAQNEEEFRAAMNVQAKYGEDRVVLQTYPEKFMDEQETVISNIVGVASDPDVKALIICQGVPGTSAAIDKVRETREDILIIVGTSGEDPSMIAERADLVLMADELGMGVAIPTQAKAQGATTFVHYSFPRHMSYALLAERRDIFKATCEEIGLEFVDATAPDPTGDAGVSGTQNFILEDVPKMVAEYGADTAFFGTNCAMQPALITAIIDEKAIYPQPCCPSPVHGFPSALNLDVPEDKAGDFPYIIDELTKLTAEAGMTGRLSTWPVPVNMMFIEAGADYAIAWIEEGFEKVDDDKLEEALNNYLSTMTDQGATINYYTDSSTGTEYKNFKMILAGFLDF